jgi:hypothetical protein
MRLHLRCRPFITYRDAICFAINRTSLGTRTEFTVFPCSCQQHILTARKISAPLYGFGNCRAPQFAQLNFHRSGGD